MATARENAINLYMHGIRDGHPRAAVAKYTGARYTQHSTGVADGAEGFIAFLNPSSPATQIAIFRSSGRCRMATTCLSMPINR